MKRELQVEYGRRNEAQPPLRRMNDYNFREYDLHWEEDGKPKRPWRVEVNFKEFSLSLEDSQLHQLFSYQDDIVEMLKQTKIFNCLPN